MADIYDKNIKEREDSFIKDIFSSRQSNIFKYEWKFISYIFQDIIDIPIITTKR